MSDLESLLAREQQAGKYESTGTFSLSLKDARRKLQQFQFKSLEQAALKLIQAVVRLESRAIWIESSDQQFVIYWAEPERTVELENLSENLEQTMLGRDSPEKDLCLGLMGFLDRQPDQIWWAEWRGAAVQSTVSLLGSQKQANLRRPPSIYQKTCALAIVAGREKLPLEREQIAGRTLFCPVPLLWNGRLMCELSWNPPRHVSGRVYWADFYFPLDAPLSQGIALKPIGYCRRILHEVQSLSGGEFEQRSTEFTVIRRYVLGQRGRFVQLLGRPPRPGLADLLGGGAPQELSTALGQAIWVVGSDQGAPGVLLCIKHGVLLDPCPLPEGMGGAVAVVASPELEVDLSQFKPILNTESWNRLQQQVLYQADTVVSQLLANPITGTSEWEGNIPLTWGLVSASGGLIGALGGFALTLDLLGGMGFVVGGLAGCLAGYRFMKKVTDRNCNRRLQALTRAVHRNV
ncbi:MAG: hypothetical protein U0931_22050 [Vulcanimicrobiota bacterium]